MPSHAGLWQAMTWLPHIWPCGRHPCRCDCRLPPAQHWKWLTASLFPNMRNSSFRRWQYACFSRSWHWQATIHTLHTRPCNAPGYMTASRNSVKKPRRKSPRRFQSPSGTSRMPVPSFRRSYMTQPYRIPPGSHRYHEDIRQCMPATR